MIIKVKFAENALTFPVRLTGNTQNLSVNLGEIQTVTDGGELYEGDYEVTPKAEAQTMFTRDKVMSNDVIIEAIPYNEVLNTAGGTTVTIS